MSRSRPPQSKPKSRARAPQSKPKSRSRAPQPKPKSRSRIAPIVGRVGAFIVGLVLLVGAYGKVIDPAAFAELVSRQGLDFLLPSGAVVFLALALEIGLGFALLLNIRQTGVLIAVSLLTVFFLGLTGYHYWAYATGTGEVAESCGCFGNLVDRNPAEAFWQDLALLLPATLMAWVARPRPEDLTPMWKVVVTGAITLAGLTFAWVAPSLPLDNLATRLKPGIDLADLCAGEGEDRACLTEAVPELADDPETPDETSIVTIIDPLDASMHPPLNDYAVEGREPPLIVLTSMSPEAIEDLQASELAPSFYLLHVPAVLLRPMYRALPRSFLVKDGRVVETVSGLPPLDRWGRPSDE